MSEVLSLRLPTQRREGFSSTSSLLVSSYICLSVITVCVVSSGSFLHWFLIPVLFCGILIGIDATDWFRGRMDIFDPVGILGLLGIHFFFLAPLLHVHWDYWMSYIDPPPDWRDWLGGMAILNCLGLLVYRFSRHLLNRREGRLKRTRWTLDRRAFFISVGFALLVTGLMQIWVYAQFGGILAYVDAATDLDPTDSMQGWGWIFMVSESFPTLAMIAFAVYASKKEVYKSWRVLCVALSVFFVVQMFFGGLRGSRSNTVWGLFWAVGIIHFWIRPVSRKMILVGCIFLVLFMYFYGFYKNVGLDALDAFKGSEARAELVEKTHRDLDTSLLGDLGRSDIQAFLLYRLLTPGSDYEYALGRTYVGALSLFVPKYFWPERPPTKVKEGTDAQHGMGTYALGLFLASNVYGLSGEAMLNFGPMAAPLSFVLLGLGVYRVRRFMITTESSDSRLLLYPFLIVLCFQILINDLDVVLFTSIKSFAVPFVVLAFCSVKQRITGSNSSPHHLCAR
jgi:hypothetical protein